MSEGDGQLGSLLGTLLGVAILANVAGNIIGKGARGVAKGASAAWGGIKETKAKLPTIKPVKINW